MGRPTKLTDEVRQKAKDYLSEIEKTKDIPYLEQLAYKLDVNMETMKIWSGEDDDFSATYKKIQIYQRYMLQKGSVLGQYNPASSIFQLKANHGMIEASELRHTGKDGEALQFGGVNYVASETDTRSDVSGSGSTQV